MKCTIEEQETCQVEKRGCEGCYYNDERRKIIEIYITENEKEDSISFDVEKLEDSEIANYTMKMLMMMFSAYKKEGDNMELEFE